MLWLKVEIPYHHSPAIEKWSAVLVAMKEKDSWLRRIVDKGAK